MKLYEITGRTTFDTICEFGPGDSLAIGLLHLSVGSKKFIGFDAFGYLNLEDTKASYHEALNFLKNQRAIPVEGLGSLKPMLKN